MSSGARANSPVRNRVPILWRLLIVFLSFTAPLSAHAVKQLYGEFKAEETSWGLNILFDAGYADPHARGDLAAAQPSRDWLVALPAAEQQKLCAEAEKYLWESLSFRSAGQPVEWKASFPDFKSQPPDFPSLLNDGAYFHVLIEPAAPPQGELTVAMAGGSHPNLVVKIGEGDAGYLTVTPGSEAALFTWQQVQPQEHQAQEHSTPAPAKGENPMLMAFKQGVFHVLGGGLDHILFVLGIFLLQRRWQALLKQSLAFTAAHTITLGLASAGWVGVPSWLVEPAIALSIVALAVENLFMTEARAWRLWLVFAFGLIHGLGFAGGLSTWIHPGQGFLPTLLSANAGVEVAQVIILNAAWLATLGWDESKAWPHFRRWACVALALAGVFWFIQRTGLLPG